MVRCEFKLTDVSKGLSKKEVKNAVFTIFSLPMRYPKSSPKFMSLEEFIKEN